MSPVILLVIFNENLIVTGVTKCEYERQDPSLVEELIVADNVLYRGLLCF